MSSIENRFTPNQDYYRYQQSIKETAEKRNGVARKAAALKAMIIPKQSLSQSEALTHTVNENINSTETCVTTEKTTKIVDQALPARRRTKIIHRTPNSRNKLFNASTTKKVTQVHIKKRPIQTVSFKPKLQNNRVTQKTVPQYNKDTAQETKNLKYNKGFWLKAEDKLLINAVNIYGPKNWRAISAKVGTRDEKQCHSRWSRSLNPEIRHVPWTQAEDKALKFYVKLFGEGNWTKISQAMPKYRTSGQCNIRYKRDLDPNLNLGPWTNGEKQRLIQSVKEHGRSWTVVATEVGKADFQCRSKWESLQKKSNSRH